MEFINPKKINKNQQEERIGKWKKNLNQLLDKENLEKSDLNNTRIKKLVVDEKTLKWTIQN